MPSATTMVFANYSAENVWAYVPDLGFVSALLLNHKDTGFSLYSNCYLSEANTEEKQLLASGPCRELLLDSRCPLKL